MDGCGVKHTVATKRKLSEMHSGKGNPMYGRKHSEETKRKIGLGTRRMNSQRQYDLDPMTVPEMSERELGYLAGIIDGEGSISIIRGRPTIRVYGTDRGLMHWLLTKVGGTATWDADKRGRAPVHQWNLYPARNVFHVCEQIWPLLIVKRKGAFDAMKFLKQKYGARVDGQNNGN